MKKALLILCMLICSVGVSSAQFKPQPFKWELKYRGELNIGGALSNVMHVSYYPMMKSSLSRPIVETIHGVSLSNYLYIGAGVGMQAYAGNMGDMYYYDEFRYYNYDKWAIVAFPIFGNIKGYLPINDNLKPFTSLSLGGTAIACSNMNSDNTDIYYVNGILYEDQILTKMKGRFYCDWGVGIEFNRWSFALGLQHQRYNVKNELFVYEGGHTNVCYINNIYKMYSNSFYLKVGIIF